MPNKNQGKSKHLTLEQRRLMIEFMKQNPGLTNDQFFIKTGYSEKAIALWKELAALINAHRPADESKEREWRLIKECWRNWVRKVKDLQTNKPKSLSHMDQEVATLISIGDKVQGFPIKNYAAYCKQLEDVKNKALAVEESRRKKQGFLVNPPLMSIRPPTSLDNGSTSSARSSTSTRNSSPPTPVVSVPMETNQIIGSSLCRTCLIPITNEGHSITALTRKLYHQITGYFIFPADHLKQICASCNDILEKVQQFKLQAERAEFELENIFDFSNEKIKSETDKEVKDIDNIIPVSPLVATPKIFVSQNSVSSKYNRDNHDSWVDLEDLEQEADSEINDEPDNFIDIEASPNPNETVDTTDTNQIHKENDFEDRSKDRSRKLLEINPTELRRRALNARLNEDLCIDEETRDELYSQNLSVDGRKKYLRPFHRNLNAPKQKQKSYTIRLVCDLCGRKFFNRWALNNHRATVHLKDLNLPEYECDLCGVKIGSKATLDYHFRKCHIQRPCPECGKIYTSRSGLKRHRDAKHLKTEKNLICEICGKAFNTHKYLRAHRTTHNPSYPCPMCPQVLVAAASLRSHIRLKHKEIQQPPPGTVLKNYDWTKQLMQESE